MGRISKGILGGFQGLVGTVIGSSWKGIDYMRSKPARRTRTPTPAQAAQHARFALIMKWVQPLTALFMLTFRNYAVHMTGVNNAVSYLIKNAITGTYPSYSIDYAMVLISRGDLPGAMNAQVSAAGSGDIRFTWVDNSGTGMAKATDKSIVVVYCPDLKAAEYTTGGDTRDRQALIINANLFVGKVVHTFIGFISADGKEIANSAYTGSLTVI